MRRTLKIVLLLAISGVLPGCAPFVLAAGMVAVSTIHQEIQKQEYTRKLEAQRQEKLRLEANEKARVEQQRLVRLQAEERRRQQLLDEQRREEAERRQREQLAVIPGQTRRSSSELADARRKLGQIADEAVDTRKRLLQAGIAGTGSPFNEKGRKDQW